MKTISKLVNTQKIRIKSYDKIRNFYPNGVITDAFSVQKNNMRLQL